MVVQYKPSDYIGSDYSWKEKKTKQQKKEEEKAMLKIMVGICLIGAICAAGLFCKTLRHYRDD